jgi:hypothetical protein
MDRKAVWIVRNGAFAAALYFAMVEHVGWLMYAIGAFAWWLFASAAWAMSDPSTSPPAGETDAPLACRTVFDAAVLASLFAAHWYWTAFAYALSCACSAMVQARATSKP